VLVGLARALISSRSKVAASLSRSQTIAHRMLWNMPEKTIDEISTQILISAGLEPCFMNGSFAPEVTLQSERQHGLKLDYDLTTAEISTS